jgi:hypothetical protein
MFRKISHSAKCFTGEPIPSSSLGAVAAVIASLLVSRFGGTSGLGLLTHVFISGPVMIATGVLSRVAAIDTHLSLSSGLTASCASERHSCPCIMDVCRRARHAAPNFIELATARMSIAIDRLTWFFWVVAEPGRGFLLAEGSPEEVGGQRGTRTPDILLVRQAL